MDYFIIALIIVAFLSIIYVWYLSKSINYYPEDQILDLSTDDDKLLSNWYATNLHIMYEYGVNELELASTYLHNVYDLEIDQDLLVVGNDIGQQYNALTNKELPKDCLFDLRSSLGISGEIAIIKNKGIRNRLRRNNNYDFKMLYEIVKSNVDKNAHIALQEILKYRWTKITEVLGLEGAGSYLYLPEEIPNVNSLKINNMYRTNLLCSDLEFNTFLKRASIFQNRTL